jgi:hypothetical protein
LKLLETFSLISAEALLDGIEDIKVIWCYIRGIGWMRHSCGLVIERNPVVGFEL